MRTSAYILMVEFGLYDGILLLCLHARWVIPRTLQGELRYAGVLPWAPPVSPIPRVLTTIH